MQLSRIVSLSLVLLVIPVFASKPLFSPENPSHSDQAAVGPHGGTVLNSQGGEYEVTIDSKKKKVDVYVLKVPEAASAGAPSQPPTLTIKSRSQPAGNATKARGRDGLPLTKEVKLRSADPWKGLPHYQAPLQLPGNLNYGNASQKGLEFEIRL